MKEVITHNKKNPINRVLAPSNSIKKYEKTK